MASWVSGVCIDGEPPRVSVCISVAVKPRDEVLPQGNADVPSWIATDAFCFFLVLQLQLLMLKFLNRISPFFVAANFKAFFGFRFRLRRRAIQVPFALCTVPRE